MGNDGREAIKIERAAHERHGKRSHCNIRLMSPVAGCSLPRKECSLGLFKMSYKYKRTLVDFKVLQVQA